MSDHEKRSSFGDNYCTCGYDGWPCPQKFKDMEAEIERLRAELAAANADAEREFNIAEWAWTIIANVGHNRGGWEAQDPEWVTAAEKWRDAYHAALAAHRERIGEVESTMPQCYLCGQRFLPTDGVGRHQDGDRFYLVHRVCPTRAKEGQI